MQGKFDTDINPASYFVNNSNHQWNNRNNDRRRRGAVSLYSLIFSEPEMIGYFSVNEYREFVADASQLRYLKVPHTQNLQLDLNDGLKEFRPKPESVKREKMDFLLRFIVNNIEKIKTENDSSSRNKFLKPDIICSRGRLVQIMCPQYNHDKKWSLIVSKYKGNVYICQPDGDDFHTIQTAYGFKFEQYLLSENPVDDPVTNVPVIESEEFYGVFESGIGSISLLYNAEIDGLDSTDAVDLTEADFEKLKFVELKTCLGPSDNRHCRWWAHTFLAGISNVTVGFRTREGIVTRIENLSLDYLKGQTGVIKRRRLIEFEFEAIDVFPVSSTLDTIMKSNELPTRPTQSTNPYKFFNFPTTGKLVTNQVHRAVENIFEFCALDVPKRRLPAYGVQIRLRFQGPQDHSMYDVQREE